MIQKNRWKTRVFSRRRTKHTLPAKHVLLHTNTCDGKSNITGRSDDGREREINLFFLLSVN